MARGRKVGGEGAGGTQWSRWGLALWAEGAAGALAGSLAPASSCQRSGARRAGSEGRRRALVPGR